MSRDKITSHLKVNRYGDFLLTDAIRPSLELSIIPQEGYRHGEYRDEEQGVKVPLLAASVSAEKLFDTFIELLEPLGEVVDVVLETSHDIDEGEHRDLQRDDIDLPVLMSYLYEHEDLLMNDGCTGIAVMASNSPMEVQFDEHKLLIIYARDLRPFERILKQCEIRRDEDLKLLTEAEHLHSSDESYHQKFEDLCCAIGVGEPAEWVEEEDFQF